MSISDIVRDNIKMLKPFRSARAEYSGTADIFLDANESPYPSDVNRYPDPYQHTLKEIISRSNHVSPEQIILGNGSDEIIDMIVRTFCEPTIDIIRFISPSFGMYEVVADINHVRHEAIELDDNFDLDVDRCLDHQGENHKVLFLCSPNNPTGNSLSREKVKRVIQGWHGIVVIDEAYIEYAYETSYVSELYHLHNVIILQTFSKAKGAAGLRLGVGYASEEIISFLNKVKPPYNVNSYTQAMAIEILEQKIQLDQRIVTCREQREKMMKCIARQKGILKVYPSDANFILVKCKDHQELYQYLMHRGVIVRDRSTQLNCAQCLRITVGLPMENDQLIQLINQFYEKDSIHR